MASEMAGLLEELQTGPVNVVGLSMGGTIAQQFDFGLPASYPQIGSGQHICRPAPRYSERLVLFLAAVYRGQYPRAARTGETGGGAHLPGADQAPLRAMLVETISRADPRAYRKAMASLGLFNSVKRLAEIKVPTLVVTGADDTTVTPARQRLLVEGIPAARQVIIPDAGHAVPVDHAEQFNRELLAFLGNP